MKQKKFFLFLFVASIFVSCNDQEGDYVRNGADGKTTYVNLSISLPSLNKLRALPEDYNPDGTYAGNDSIETLDIYLEAGNGSVESLRLTAADIAVSGTTVSPSEPFKTTAGAKTIYVVLNDPSPLASTVDENTLLPIAGLAQIKTANSVDYDVITMTGKTTGTVTIVDNVTEQNVIDQISNNFDVDVVRVASRAIVTIADTANQTIKNGSGVVIGSVSNITYSVAQGTNQVYWAGKADYSTWGYNYVPADSASYVDQASTYYDYSDLSNSDAVPTNPAAAGGYKSLRGKFLFENTHANGSYVNGNTAYILVRATFEPLPSAIVDGGSLSNGTFYVGRSNGLIYSTKAAAQTPPLGVANQRVTTYVGGKMLNYAWLNPDNIQTPQNSPVVRNNIYHVNITGFNKLGYNWNPLYPEDPHSSDPSNPDPNPDQGDPVLPINPIDPLTPKETYMSVEVTVLDWTVHSYDIVF